MDILVLGAGAWGTALAISAGARHRVTLWARDPAQAAALAARGENVHYLPGHRLPAGVTVASPRAGGIAALAQRHELVIIATPMAGLRETLTALRDCTRPVAWLCKGFELPASQPYGQLGHEICAEVAPALAGGVLSGPSFAQEVAQGRPSALVAASDAALVRDALVSAFHGPAMRVYATEDLPGVEVGGAVKNVLAIATGLCDGLALGLNARAALITRGLAEMTRLGVALGAERTTFAGLAGLGDLVLTCTGSLSRNYALGVALGKGETLAHYQETHHSATEGVNAARAALQLARRAGVELPVTAQIAAVLFDEKPVGQAVADLMERALKSEQWT